MPKKPSQPKPTKPKKGGADPQRKLFEKLLALACYANDLPAAENALKHDPTLAQDPQPLLNAAFAGADKIIELLLKNGADPNAPSKTGGAGGHLRPLHRICEFKKTVPKHEGHIRAIQVLLKGGADPTFRAGSFRLTPLAMAAMGGYADFIPLLAKKTCPNGADIFHAAVTGDASQLDTLLKQDPTLAGRQDLNDMTPLMYAVASRLGHTHKLTARNLTDITTLLLKAGANPNATVQVGEHSRSAVSFAVPNPALLKLLLDAGGDPAPALINALWEADYDTAALLVDYGANPKDPKIAPHVGGFAHWGHFQQSRWLIERGAPVDAVDRYNTTALQSAARRGARGDFVEFLLENNANPLITTDDNKTPYDLAKEKNKTKLLPLLKAAMARAHLHAPGPIDRHHTDDDHEFEAGLPSHMRSKRQTH